MPTLQRPRRSYLVELAQFHSPEYLEFLQRISPEEQEVHRGLVRNSVFTMLHESSDPITRELWPPVAAIPLR